MLLDRVLNGRSKPLLDMTMAQRGAPDVGRKRSRKAQGRGRISSRLACPAEAGTMAAESDRLQATGIKASRLEIRGI